MALHAHKHHKGKISKGAAFAKIKWDEAKHARDPGGRFKFKPGSEEFKAEPFGTPKTSGVKGDDVIKLHVTANPKKDGSAAATDFAKYQDNMTVAEFKNAVGPKAAEHIAYDSKKGYITIHSPQQLAVPKPGVQPAPPAPAPPQPAPAPAPAPQPSPSPTPATPAPTKTEPSFSDLVITSKTKGVKGEDIITLHAVSNPKKAGSKAAADFAKYKDGMTVAEFHAAIGDKGKASEHILHDLKKGYISVHHPNDLEDMKSGLLSPGDLAAHQKMDDKKLGVVTSNPFSPGSANHDTFEATAAKLGLTTPKMVAAAPKPAAPAPEPTTTLKAADLQPNDVVETYLGNKYTVAEYKQKWKSSLNLPDMTDAEFHTKLQSLLDNGNVKVVSKAAPAHTIENLHPDDVVISSVTGAKIDVKGLKDAAVTDKAFEASVNKNLASGKWSVTKAATVQTVSAQSASAQTHIKPVAETLADDVVLTNSFGAKTTVKQYKATSVLSEKEKIKALQQDLDSGYMKVEGPVPPAPPAPKAPAGQPQQAYDVAKIQTGDNLVLLSQTNPYPKPSAPAGSALTPDEMVWVKYQSFHQKPSKQMTMSSYMNTQAGSSAEKHAALQQMIDQGHVKVVTLDDMMAAAAAKQAAQQATLKTKHKVHFEQVSETKLNQWHDEPKWGKVPVVKDLAQAGWGNSLSGSNMNSQQVAEMEAARKAAGLKFNNKSVPGVGFYTGSGYGELNKTLRESGHSALSSSYKERAAELDKLQETVQDDLIMWRGIQGHGGKNDIPPPPDFTDMGYASLSFNPVVSKSFAGTSSITSEQILFRVRVPKGAKGAFVSRRSTESESMRDEAEVITARGTKFRYVSHTYGVKVGKGGQATVVELEIVRADGTPF
jgi:hypothetical protein